MGMKQLMQIIDWRNKFQEVINKPINIQENFLYSIDNERNLGEKFRWSWGIKISSEKFEFGLKIHYPLPNKPPTT